MEIKLKERLLEACRHLLKPVVRLLLHSGVTYREFAETAKQAFVEVAGEEFGLQGRRTNASRVSILTGIGRKEVARLRAVSAARAGEFQTRMSPLTRIAATWHQDPEYRDADGKPRQLRPDELEALVAQHAGDLPVTALLKELQRQALVAPRPDGTFEVSNRSFVPGRVEEESIRMLGTHLNDLGSTIAHNLLDTDTAPVRFQRVVSNEAIDASVLDRFRRLAAEKGQVLLELLDDWLEEHQQQAGGEALPSHRAGVGIYFFEHKLEQEVSI